MGFGKNGSGFGGGGSSSAGNIIYKGASPTTITVGGLPAGSAIYGLSLQAIDQDILCPYINPSFASFSNNVTTLMEVGTSITGSKIFYYTFSNPANITDNTINITDVTNTRTLGTGLSIAQGSGVSLSLGGTITNSAPATQTWAAQATNTQSGTLSDNFSVSWEYLEWYGNNTLATLTAAQIQNATYLQNSYLSGSFGGSYSFAAGGYKWFVWDDSLGSPTAVTGFKDAATNLQIAMAQTSDNAFFSNVQNGWYYGLVSVTQNGVTSNKRCYRTANQLGGTITAIVS